MDSLSGLSTRGAGGRLLTWPGRSDPRDPGPDPSPSPGPGQPVRAGRSPWRP